MFIPNIQYITVNLLFSYILQLFYIICLIYCYHVILYHLNVPCQNWNDQFDNVPNFFLKIPFIKVMSLVQFAEFNINIKFNVQSNYSGF